MARVFIDTNVVVYANDHRDPGKRSQAERWLRRAAEEDEIVISTQVLQEFAAVALAKLGLDPQVVISQVQLLGGARVVPVSTELVARAVTICAQYRVSYWDASILAAAESAGCTELYSEDLNAGQVYAGVRVVNPFAE